jgi:murein DD-endopeptidase MepM/ murein hydrolase activator NlpD
MRLLLRKAFTPVTIMLIPHSNSRSLRLKVPSVGIVISVILWAVGMLYVMSVAKNALEYNLMKQKLDYYSSQFLELRGTISTLKKAEQDFQKIFSFKSREQVLKNLDSSDSGSIDMDNLKQQIKATMESVGDIRDYLGRQRDIYISTPRGWPAEGHITSPFGERRHPQSGQVEFHGGVDIAAEAGLPVKATADGIISFAGWSGGNGNLVVVEHGMGYSTFYAHNKTVAVHVGQKVKRGDVISHIGSTGNSTGPHVHYEIWHDGRAVNPASFLEGRT